MTRLVFLIGVICLLLLNPADANIKGAVQLDEYNFDRFISRFDTVLVKFDAVYPYGDKHEAFKAVAEEMKDSDEIIFVTIGIKDFGEHDNQKLAERFGIKTKNQWPALRLFVKGEDEPFALEHNHVWSVDEIKKFIKEHTNVYLGLQGCLKDFDKLAAEFAGSRNKQDVLERAEEQARGLKNEADKKAANIYIKCMKKALEKDSFIQEERRRLQKIIKEGKVKAEKKQDLQIRTNILSSFNIERTEL